MPTVSTFTPLGVLLFSTLPVILGGVLNLMFIRSSLFPSLRAPMDCGLAWPDGVRLFGPNKTWKGLLGCVFFTALSMIVFCMAIGSALESLTIYSGQGTGSWPAWALEGALLGLAYIVFELPNSLVKRRVGIGAGQNGSGRTGILFRLVDQVDSILGCSLVLLAYNQITGADVALLLLFGAGIHWAVSFVLRTVGLR